MLEITISYQDKEIALSRPGTKYGSNLEEFTELVALAFAGVGLEFDGTLKEIPSGPNMV